nr:oleosin 1-like [Tanacetum cinerariifolium]
MARNGSEVQPVSNNQQLYQNIAKISKVATIFWSIIIFSPVLIIFSPLWVPAFFVYWMYSYFTGRHPIGADQVVLARDAIFETVDEVKNKVEQLGKDITKEIAKISGGSDGDEEGERNQVNAAELTLCCSGCITFPLLPRVPLSYQAIACSLSTLHFLKILEKKLESMKILKNKLESMKILENKLESLKLQENQPVDGLVSLSIKEFTSESVLATLLKSKDNKF